MMAGCTWQVEGLVGARAAAVSLDRVVVNPRGDEPRSRLQGRDGLNAAFLATYISSDDV